MSWQKHDDNCQGCRPILLDLETGEALSDDTPEMMVVNKIWAETTLAERQAYHRSCCQASKKPQDIAVMITIQKRIQAGFNHK